MNCLDKISIIEINNSLGHQYYFDIAKIHQNELTSGFLSTLGTGFLRKMYYYIGKSPSAFIYAAVLDRSELIAFICGSLDTNKMYREVLLRGGINLAFELFKHFYFLRYMEKIVETIRYPTKNFAACEHCGEIINFCVAAPYQGKKIGKLLMDTLVARFEKEYASEIKIVTGEEQFRARKFYEAYGAKIESSISVHGQTKSFVYKLRV